MLLMLLMLRVKLRLEVVVRLQEHAVVLLLMLLMLLLLQMLQMLLMMLLMLLMLLVLPRHGGIPAGALLLLSLLVLLRSHVVQGMQPRRLRMRMRMRMHLCRLRWACSSAWDGTLLGYLLLHLLLLLGKETLFGLLPLLVAALLLLLGAHRDGRLQEQGLGRLCAAVFALWRLLLGQVLWLQRQ
jgi:hypothetical protein